MTKREEKGGKRDDSCLPELGSLATYVGYARGGIHTTTIDVVI
jgi:hypothetical protein